MKINPNCTRPDCPKEFPEKQNFCNICGARLISVIDLQQSQAGEDFYKTVVSGATVEKKLSNEELNLQEIEDILQIPQEPLDPMKTIIAPPEHPHHVIQEDKIFDIPESEELILPSARAEKPFETPLAKSFELQTKGEKQEESSESEPFPLKVLSKQSDSTKIYPTPIQEDFSAPQQEEKIDFSQTLALPVSGSVTEEPPKKIMESPYTEPQAVPADLKPPYEPPSPFAKPQTSLTGTKSRFTEESPFSETPSSQPPTVFQTSSENPSQVQEQQTSWTPPPPPQSSWENQPIGPGSTFTPPASVKLDNTLATISLVCGILSIVCCGFITGIPAIITGFIAKNRAESNPHLYSGRGMAIVGILLGTISIVLTIILVIFNFLGIITGLR